jgi:hypothetical protein
VSIDDFQIEGTGFTPWSKTFFFKVAQVSKNDYLRYNFLCPGQGLENDYLRYLLNKNRTNNDGENFKNRFDFVKERQID